MGLEDGLEIGVALTPSIERVVRRKVATGRYAFASEMLREALKLLDRQDRLRESARRPVRRQIDEGWESLLQGKTVAGEEFFRELARRERALRRRGNRADSMTYSTPGLAISRQPADGKRFRLSGRRIRAKLEA